MECRNIGGLLIKLNFWAKNLLSFTSLIFWDSLLIDLVPIAYLFNVNYTFIFSESDWSSRLLFQCRLCQKQCDGFHMAVSHLKHVHSLEDKEQAEQEQCPLCPKQFRKIDNLKVHVWRHVNRVIPGMANSKQ